MRRAGKSFLSPTQAARAIGVSESSIRRWCDQGLLRSTRTAGGHRRIEQGALIEFARERGLGLSPGQAVSASGQGGRTASDSILITRALACMDEGDGAGLRELVLALLAAGRPPEAVCDDILAPAMRDVGARWESGEIDVYAEHRASQLVLDALRAARALVPTPPSGALLAVCASMSGDLGSIAPTMTSLVLQSRGWRTELLGGNTPAVSLCRAIGALRPALLALSFNHILDEDACVRDCETVFQASLAGGAMLAIGGRAISADLRRRLRADFFGDTLTHLVTFADGVARRYRPAHTHSASG